MARTKKKNYWHFGKCGLRVSTFNHIKYVTLNYGIFKLKSVLNVLSLRYYNIILNLGLLSLDVYVSLEFNFETNIIVTVGIFLI